MKKITDVLTQEQTLRIGHVIRTGIDELSKDISKTIDILGDDWKRIQLVIDIENKVYDIIKGVK